MWTNVVSSNINALSFEDGKLKVKFSKGTVYQYEGVPQEVYEKILHAPSVSIAFFSLVKSFPARYPFEIVK